MNVNIVYGHFIEHSRALQTVLSNSLSILLYMKRIRVQLNGRIDQGMTRSPAVRSEARLVLAGRRKREAFPSLNPPPARSYNAPALPRG